MLATEVAALLVYIQIMILLGTPILARDLAALLVTNNNGSSGHHYFLAVAGSTLVSEQ